MTLILFLIGSIKVCLPAYTKRKFTQSIIRDSKDDKTIDIKSINIQDSNVIKLDKIFIMNELNICADDYVDQIDFIFKY